MINVGIAGLGPAWESRYQPALTRLKQRISVRAVYDAVHARAEQAADEWNADVTDGLKVLLERRDVRAVLLLDTSWHGPVLLRWICACRKPAYISGSLGDDEAELRRLAELTAQHRLTLMPEFSRRFTPATTRLKELLATKLGRVRSVNIDASAPADGQLPDVPGQGPGSDFLIGLIDWCCYVVGTQPVRVAVAGINPQRTVTLQFERFRSGGDPPICHLRLHPPSGADPHDPFPVRFEIECDSGRAEIGRPTTVDWQSAGEQHRESLTSERTEVEVMLDHFCRRAVGALIPVPDIADVHRNVQLARLIEQAMAAGTPIDLAATGSR